MINLIQFYDLVPNIDHYRQAVKSNIDASYTTPIAYGGELMPFQCFVGNTLGANFAFQVLVVPTNGGEIKDITGNLTLNKISTSDGKYLMHYLPEVVGRLELGAFYLKIRAISLGGAIEVIKYSTVICNSSPLSVVGIEFYSDKQIGEALYQTTFKNYATFKAMREYVEPELTEEVKVRQAIELPIQSVLIDQVSFKILTTDDIRNALHAIALHEYATFTYENKTYISTKRCTISSSYFAENDIHEVTIIVPYNATIYRESIANETFSNLAAVGDFNNDFNNDFNIL